MPWGLILIVVGLVLALATSYVTLGWILFGLGAGITLLTLLFFGAVAAAFRKNF